MLSTHGSLLGYRKYLPEGSPRIPYEFYDRLTLKTTAKKADAIVVSSKFEYEDAIEFGVNPNKIRVIPMGVEIESLEEKAVCKSDESLRILFVGRLARVRRVELLLQALRELDIPFCATIVGGEAKTATMSRSGYMAQLKTLRSDLGLEGKVEFAGPQTADRIKAFYRESDLFVYPSLYENFGQPILEAAAFGLPIISTDVGVARDLVENNDTGFIVSGEPKQIANKIKDLADPKTRFLMGKAIQKRVEINFGWNKIMEDYKRLYEYFC